MSRRTLPQIASAIQKLLKTEGELSITQIAIRTGSQWCTANKTLELMKTLDMVEERQAANATQRSARLFRLKK